MISLHNIYYGTHDATHSMGGGLGGYTLTPTPSVTVIHPIFKSPHFQTHDD